MTLPPEAYLWFKSLHIIGVVVWFAGLFYLVRLFIYHVEAEELDQRAQQLAEEKELLYLDETFVHDEKPITDSYEIDPVEDLKGAGSLLDEDLQISEEVDLIEEDF